MPVGTGGHFGHSCARRGRLIEQVDRAKAFYSEKLGFHVDHDVEVMEGNRVLQLTPPGSGCSIVIREESAAGMAAGSLRGLQLVVPDIKAARPDPDGNGWAVQQISARA